MEWISTWRTKQSDISGLSFTAERHEQKLTLKNNLSGSAVRVHFANPFGKKPLVISSASLCVRGPNGEIKSHAPLFGASGIALDAGCEVYSDSLQTRICPGDEIITETRVSDESPVSGAAPLLFPLLAHLESNGSMQPSGSVEASGLTKQLSEIGLLYGIDRVEVLAEPAKLVAFFGDSITQMGFWSEPLTLRLYDSLRGGVTTRNHGISGNRLLHDSPPAVGGMYGIAAEKRFEDDVFHDENPDVVIIQIGVNDLCHPVMFELPEQAVTAAQIIRGLSDLAETAHRHGARAVCCTILPFMGYQVWNSALEQTRREVNEWIRGNRAFDHCLDFATFLCDTADIRKMAPDCHIGDWLHPSPKGGERIAAAIDLTALSRLL